MLTRDADAGKAFYPAVFGWAAGRPSFAGAPETYTVWELDGRPVGGMMQMSDEYFPAEIPPHWVVVFAVADADATVAKARALGATVTNRAHGHADRTLRRPGRSPGGLLHGDAARVARLIGAPRLAPDARKT